MTAPLIALGPGCGDAPQDTSSPEALGRNTAAVWNGSDDADDPNANAVVVLWWAGDTVPACTGTLVTPRLVLTAAHCFAGSQNIEQLEVRFGPDSRNPHGLVHPLPRPEGWRSPVPGSYSNPYGPIDIGLLVLERSVVSDHVYPVRPTLQRPFPSPTPIFIPGTLFEYDNTSGDFLSYTAGFGETHNIVPGFYRQIQLATSHYSNIGEWEPSLWNGHAAYWRADFEYASSYWGADFGDSGGPLFWVPTSDIYGVRHLVGVVHNGISPIQVDNNNPDMYTLWVDITSPFLKSWLESSAGAADPKPHQPNRWFGELDYNGPCDTTKDVDCDRVYNWHDNCEQDFNPDQSDADQDLWGDECDNCPEASNQGQENCNAEMENIQWPPRDAITASMMFDPGLVATIKTRNQQRRPGDACDMNPCTKTDGVETKLPWLVPANATCGMFYTGCAWKAETGIVRSPISSAAPPGLQGTTKMRYCVCDRPHASEQDRRNFAQACDCNMASMNSFRNSSYWHSMRSSLGNGPALDDNAPSDMFSYPTQGAPAVLNWEWLHDLPALTGVQPPSGVPTPEGVEAWIDPLSVAGILWSHVETLAIDPFDFRNYEFASHFRAMDVKIHLGGDGVVPYHETGPGWDIDWPPLDPIGPCITCGLQDAWLWPIDVLDEGPVLAGLIPGSAMKLKTNPQTAQALMAARNGSSTRFVAASDARYWAAAKGFPVGGVLFDVSTHRVTDMLGMAPDGSISVTESPTHGGLYSASVAQSSSPPLLALSAGRRTLFELTDAQPSWELRVNDLFAGEVTSLPISGASLSTPMAMTYRYEDDSLYVLDLTGHKHKTAKLLRVDREGHAVVRALWNVHGQHTRVFLSTAHNGDILLTAAKQNSFRIVRLDPDTTTMPTRRFAANNHGRLLAAPHSDAKGITAAVLGHQHQLRIVEVADWAPGSTLPGWKPGPEWCFE